METQHTLATGECFKLMLMMAKTESGNMVRQYFLDIENAFSTIAEYLVEIEKQKDNEMLEKEKKNKKNMIIY